MRDEELWRRRFRTYVLVRLVGLAIFLFGVAIASTDLLREGGWPLVGAIIALMGLIDGLFAPRLLKKVWEQEDARR